MTLDEITNKIISFKDLEDGWDDPESISPSSKTHKLALFIAEALPPGPWDIVPCNDGSIMFELDDAVIEVYSKRKEIK